MSCLTDQLQNRDIQEQALKEQQNNIRCIWWIKLKFFTSFAVCPRHRFSVFFFQCQTFDESRNPFWYKKTFLEGGVMRASIQGEHKTLHPPPTDESRLLIVLFESAGPFYRSRNFVYVLLNAPYVHSRRSWQATFSLFSEVKLIGH